MHRLTILAALSAASLAPAQGQNCLTTLFTGNVSTSAGCAAMFNMTANAAILVQSISCKYIAAVGTPVGLDVYLTPNAWNGNETNAAAWTLVGSDNGTVVAAGSANPTVFTFASPILINAGSWGVSLVARNTSHQYSSTGATATFSDSILTLDLGVIQATPFVSTLFNPRIWNGTICYVPAQGYAFATEFGAGCGQGDPASFYELFTTTNPFDLQNQSFSMTPAGTGYVVVPSASPIVQPTAGQLTLSDDQTVPVTLPWSFPAQTGATNTVWLCSNGWVALQATTAVDLGETVAGLLSGPARLCPMWDDLNPAAGGTVHAEQDPSNPALFHITFLNVPEFSIGGSNTFQLTLHQTGAVEFKYGAASLLDCLVGYSPGGGVRDPGPTDLSGLTAILLGDDRPALRLQTSARPVLGTTFDFATSRIGPGTTLGGVVLSFARFVPGIDLTPAGAPGCFQHVGVDVVNILLVTGNTANLPFTLPNNASLAGSVFHGQSAMFTPGLNALGVVTSNGIRVLVDIN